MKSMSHQLQSHLCDAAATDQPQHRLSLPKLDILAVDADEEPQQELEAEDDVKDGPLDPHKVKDAHQKEIQNLWDPEVYEYSTEVESRTRTGRDPVGLKWIDTNKGGAEHDTVHVWCVRRCAMKGLNRSSRPPLLETLRFLLGIA